MLEKDVILSKISIIKNCLKTIQKVTDLNSDKLNDIITQDVFVLNLQRAIQASVDMANVIISEKGWELPASYREVFDILHKENVISRDVLQMMKKMVGFRNIAVHDYQQLDVNILKSILSQNLKDLEVYYSQVCGWIEDEGSDVE